jgi:hypothetical protein
MKVLPHQFLWHLVANYSTLTDTSAFAQKELLRWASVCRQLPFLWLWYFLLSLSLSLSLLSKINPNKSMSTLVKSLTLSFFMKGQTSMIICLSLDVDDNCGRCSASSPCPGHSAPWCTSTHLQLERSREQHPCACARCKEHSRGASSVVFASQRQSQSPHQSRLQSLARQSYYFPSLDEAFVRLENAIASEKEPSVINQKIYQCLIGAWDGLNE